MGITASTAIRAIFGLQLGIALVLLSRDFAQIAPSLRWPSFAPAPTVPVSPGDQTRRFNPSKLPARAPRPGQPIPSTADMPARLFFEDRTDGGTVMIGQIREGDLTRFLEWIDNEQTAPEKIWLNSPGGSVADALGIGRQLRARGIATAMDPDAVCLSACPYILMGGTARHVSSGAWVGVHQHYYGQNIVQPAFMAVEDIQRSQAEVIGYFDEMGIDPLLMRHSLATPPDEIYILVEDELTTYGIATEILPADG